MGSFWLQVNEMNGKISFRMSVKFATLVYMGKDFVSVHYVLICKCTGSELQSMW